MIIDRDSNPKDTVYYISACILEISNVQNYNVEGLYEELKEQYNDSLEYTIYLLSLDFLFLIEKISISKEGFLECL
ncbi:ABC-three component system middle component 6 [Halobacillus amylolyticus]|uniref:ABC-three component system middle component 6 n=1 Tax=Halobacillus amylolyticus TaxID=2932259 RepID=UPI0037BEE94D